VLSLLRDAGTYAHLALLVLVASNSSGPMTREQYGQTASLDLGVAGFGAGGRSSLLRRIMPDGVMFVGAAERNGMGTLSFCAVEASVFDMGGNVTFFIAGAASSAIIIWTFGFT
jgi:hypothetical protein